MWQSLRTGRALYTGKPGDNTFVLTPDDWAGAKAGQMLDGFVDRWT